MKTISEYLAAQVREALGPVNKWYCSQCYGREITDPEMLLRYYITHNGGSHIAPTYANAKGAAGPEASSNAAWQTSSTQTATTSAA